jgi:uncharacterized protein (DUF1697 family)
MATLVALLRGINLGSTNRIAMPALRSALAEAGFENVRTYVQSGNIVLDTELEDGALAEIIAALLADRFELDVPVVVRSAAELAEVVAENPFPAAALTAPKLLQVTFLSSRLPDDVAERVRGASSGVLSKRVRMAPPRHPCLEARPRLERSQSRGDRDRAKLDHSHDPPGDGRRRCQLSPRIRTRSSTCSPTRRWPATNSRSSLRARRFPAG